MHRRTRDSVDRQERGHVNEGVGEEGLFGLARGEDLPRDSRSNTNEASRVLDVQEVLGTAQSRTEQGRSCKQKAEIDREAGRTED